MSSYKKYTKDFILASLSRVVVVLSQIYFVKLYTSNVGLYNLGIYFYLVGIINLIVSIVFTPIEIYQQSKIYKVIKEKETIIPFLYFNAKLTLIYLLVSSFSGLFIVYFEIIPISNFVLIVCIPILIYLSQGLRTIINNQEYKAVVSISYILESTIKITIFGLFILRGEVSEYIMLYSWLLSMIGVICYEIYLINNFKIITNFKLGAKNILVKDIVKISIPILSSSVTNWIQFNLLKTILVPLGYAEVIGVYGTLESIGRAIMGSISQVYTQIFNPRLHTSDGRFINVYILGAIFVSFSTLLMGLILSKEIVYIIAAPIFTADSLLIGFGIVAEAGNFIIGSYTVYYTITDKIKRLLRANLYGFLGVSMMSIILVSYYNISIYTVGIPLVISQLIICIYLYKIQ